jgi:hypothetical protein
LLPPLWSSSCFLAFATTTLKLLLLSHFYCHHDETPLAFTLLLPPHWSSSCFHASTATTMKLLLLSRFYYHHVEAPLVGVEAPNPWSSCEFCAHEALSYSSSL